MNVTGNGVQKKLKFNLQHQHYPVQDHHHNHQILKSKAKEPPKVLSSSGTRGTRFISVKTFQLNSVLRLETIAFLVMAIGDTKLSPRFLKNIHLFPYFQPLQEFKCQEKCLCKWFPARFRKSVPQITKVPDVCTIYRPYWRTKEVLQHGGTIQGCIILRGTFRRLSQIWDNANTFNFEKCLHYLSSIISQFLDLIHGMVFDFFDCVTMYTLS